MKTIKYKGIQINYTRSWAVVSFGGIDYSYKTLKQAKEFINIIAD